jgi:hypothetical protein
MAADSLQAYRFGQEVIHAGLLAALAVFLKGIGRQCNNVRLTRQPGLTDGAGGIQAIHFRHLHIHQHQFHAPWLTRSSA